MSREVHRFSITVAVGSTPTAPQKDSLTLPQRVVDRVQVRVPPGPRGEVGFALGSSGVAVLPQETGAYIVTDDELIDWPLDGLWDSGGWQLFSYNTGLFAHKLEVRFLCSLTGAAVAAPAPAIVSGDLQTAPVGPPPDVPPVTLPPLPPAQLPQLPPAPTIPPIQLPPAPTIPPIQLPPPPPLPPLPTLPGVTGAPPAPAPRTLNFWEVSMGRVLAFPDQSAGPRFDELLVENDGSVGWYAFTGGAGQWESYRGPASNQGGNVAEVDGTFVLYQGKIYLYIVGTTKAGVRWLKVCDPVAFRVVQDWIQQPGEQSTMMPLSKRAAP